MQYKLKNGFDGILAIQIESNTEWWVKNDPQNRHWQEYQAWLAADENNQPLPADEE